MGTATTKSTVKNVANTGQASATSSVSAGTPGIAKNTTNISVSQGQPGQPGTSTTYVNQGAQNGPSGVGAVVTPRAQVDPIAVTDRRVPTSTALRPVVGASPPRRPAIVPRSRSWSSPRRIAQEYAKRTKAY